MLINELFFAVCCQGQIKGQGGILFWYVRDLGTTMAVVDYLTVLHWSTDHKVEYLVLLVELWPLICQYCLQ